MNRYSGFTPARWALILAGGEGTRLRAYTRSAFGHQRPKQFCSLLSGVSLLEKTRDRITSTIPASQQVFVLTEHHRPYFTPVLQGARPYQFAVQPMNRGTAPAVLFGLRRITAFAPDAVVALFPADHHFVDESRFMQHVDAAFDIVQASCHSIVLLGIQAEYPEVEYGWIEPAATNCPISRVSAFWEKPRLAQAHSLLETGCLWNSFVLVARAAALEQLFRLTVPSLTTAFDQLEAVQDCDSSIRLDGLYRDLPATDFASHVLASAPSRLSVLRVDGTGWSDLGNPERLQAAAKSMVPA